MKATLKEFFKTESGSHTAYYYSSICCLGMWTLEGRLWNCSSDRIITLCPEALDANRDSLRFGEVWWGGGGDLSLCAHSLFCYGLCCFLAVKRLSLNKRPCKLRRWRLDGQEFKIIFS